MITDKTPDPAEVVRVAREIEKELDGLTHLILGTSRNGWSLWVCPFCNGIVSDDSGKMYHEHKPGCLWLRLRAALGLDAERGGG